MIAPRSIRLWRMKTCRSCEFYKLGVCQVCKCYLPMKTSFEKASCPKEKWGAIK